MNKDAKKTLPTDSNSRKEYPIFRGVLRYFPAALAGISKVSKLGNDKHNPGEELHHARGKSVDHGDCVLRHLVDVEDLITSGADSAAILTEVDQFAWRALAFSQELHERLGGSPLAPGAKASAKDNNSVTVTLAPPSILPATEPSTDTIFYENRRRLL